MRNLKKVASLLLAMVMVLSMSLTAFAAADTPHTITVKNEVDGHEYTAYKVFEGDISDGKLTNIQWGAGVDSANLLLALKADNTNYKVTDEGGNVIDNVFAACESAEDVANALQSIAGDNAAVEAFANAVYANLGTAAVTSQGSTAVTGDDDIIDYYEYTLDVTGDGYYFIKDTNTSGDVNTETDYAETKYILQVVGDVAINAKSDVPTLDKVIESTGDSGTTTSEFSTAAVGDVVDFVLTSEVPKMEGYDKYYFVVTDTLSAGLTFNEGDNTGSVTDDVVITVGDATLTDADYTVTITVDDKGTTEDPSDDTTQVKIVFTDFYGNYNDNVGEAITIRYSATVNEYAVIGDAGNPNTAILEYSSNPNVDAVGDGDEPADGDITGKTPEQETYTYVTGIDLEKTDATGNVLLPGAVFEITGEAINKVLVTQEVFTEDAAGTYYKLNDGTYTEVAPTTETEDEYDSTTTKYKLTYEDKLITETETVKAQAISGADGILHFYGLNAGTYTITEITAPDGYNKLSAPINITIDWAAPAEGTTDCTWSAEFVDGTTNAAQPLSVNEDGIITFSVLNQSGSTLPTTGGIGTTVFYIVGGILVIGAIVVLITRKRMDLEDK